MFTSGTKQIEAAESAAADVGKMEANVGHPAQIQETTLQKKAERPTGKTTRVEPLRLSTLTSVQEMPSVLARFAADLRQVAEQLKNKRNGDTIVVPIGSMPRGGAMPQGVMKPESETVEGQAVELAIPASAQTMAVVLTQLANKLEETVQQSQQEKDGDFKKAPPIKKPPEIIVVLNCNGGGDFGPPPVTS